MVFESRLLHRFGSRAGERRPYIKSSGVRPGGKRRRKWDEKRCRGTHLALAGPSIAAGASPWSE